MIRQQTQPVLFRRALQLIFVLGGLSGCVAQPKQADMGEVNAAPLAVVKTDITALGKRFGMSDDIYYHLVAAELAGQYEDLGNAADAYSRVLELSSQGGLSRDDQYVLARRAWEIGRYSKNNDLADRAAQAWQQQDNSFAPRLARVVAIESSDKATQQAVLTEVLDLPPTERAAFAAVLVKQYAGSAQSEEALRWAEDWLEHRPNDVDVLLAGAMIAEQGHATAMAYQWWYRHADLVSGSRFEVNSRAHAAANLRLLGEPAEAANILRGLHEQNPNEHWVALEYGRALLQSGQAEASVAVMEKLAGTLNTNAEVMYLAGVANYSAKYFSVAAQYFEKALTAGYPEHEARYWTGVAKLSEGKPKYAIEWLGGLEPGQYWRGAQRLIGDAFAQLGNWGGFDAHFDHLRDAEAEQVAQWYLVQAQSLINASKLERAADVLDQAVVINAGDLDVRYQRGMLNGTLKRFQLAEVDLRHVVDADPDNANALNALGYMLIDSMGDADQGVPLVRRALDLEPTSAAIMDSYGWGLLLQGQLDEGLHWLEKAWHRRKDHEIGAHLGEALWRKHELDRARVIWQEALGLSPGGRENKVLQAYERLNIDTD